MVNVVLKLFEGGSQDHVLKSLRKLFFCFGFVEARAPRPPDRPLGCLLPVAMSGRLADCYTREYALRLVVAEKLPGCVERKQQLLHLSTWQQQPFLFADGRVCAATIDLIAALAD